MSNKVLDSSSLETLYKLFLKSKGINSDSRTICKGELFFALSGANFDGNSFALQALDAGAIAAIVSKKKLAEQDARCFYVSDTLLALGELAHHHRMQLQTPLLLITGTNGKTTTKELTAAVLRKKYNLLATEGNLNNHIGLPLTLLKLRPEHEFAVIEAGASHEGEIAYLSEIAAPDYGIITNIGRAHLEGFGSYEGVIRTKTELYRYLHDNGGVAFVNHLDPLLCSYAGRLHSVYYGETTKDSVFGEVIQSSDSSFKLSLSLFIGGESLNIDTNLVGSYNLFNILAASAIGHQMKVPTKDIVSAIASYEPSNHRSQLITKTERGNRLIVDVYNANPSSMEASIDNYFHLSNIKDFPCLLLGDMLELGVNSCQEHRAILFKIQKYTRLSSNRKIILIGKEFGKLKKEFEGEDFEFFPDTDSFLQHLKLTPIENRTILLKASHGIHLEKILSFL